jgi:16S rRNA (guanine527-N7)-methyltransferase
MIGEDARGRLSELAGRCGLGAPQQGQLAGLLDALLGNPHAPSALRSPERAIDWHLADSLVALELEAVREARTLADLGSGAGFPGLPLAVALPRSEVWLIESHRRRCAYLEGVAAHARAANARVVCSRLEHWSAPDGGVDVALARALASQAVVLEYAAPLLRSGGLLVDWRGRRVREQERGAILAAEQLGLQLLEIRRVVPFAGAEHRHLHLYLKVSATPAGFPRRAGMARKRPLGRT